MIDPKFYTNAEELGNTAKDTRTGLSKEMDIIINVEDQTWRSSPESGLQSETYTPIDSELANVEDHTFRVKWIRVYKPVEKNRRSYFSFSGKTVSCTVQAILGRIR